MTAHRSLARRAVSVAAVVTAVVTASVVLAACGSDDSHDSHDAGSSPSTSASASAPASAGAHNTQDVAFAKGMIPHHRQAVQMAALAESRASSPEVKSLAADIKKAQDPEIRTMSGWLTSWGEQVPEDMPGMDHSGHNMPGMMGAGDMAELEKMSGKEFDTAFLDMMVKHHQGAVEMARTENSKGSYRPARTMADAIIRSQSAEIEQMNKLLKK
ncbi:DUF305 domain-containing protein [Streptomyces sp. NPDC026206]|uniref:DUF305 domain-containing protein n=1 Tax=Streptomyces sp. NPDC026206 TaxID=3157089 RepID=UPI0033ECE366